MEVYNKNRSILTLLAKLFDRCYCLNKASGLVGARPRRANLFIFNVTYFYPMRFIIQKEWLVHNEIFWGKGLNNTKNMSLIYKKK